MCLGTVCQVIAIPSEGAVLTRDSGRELSVSLLTLPDPVSTGDWLLVHCGLALARLTEAEALDALSLRRSEGST